MEDIPIDKAVLIWTPGKGTNEPAFAVREVHHPDMKKFGLTDGACCSYWNANGPEKRLLLLMKLIWEITAFWEIPPSLMTEELLKIPEYRSLVHSSLLPKEFQEERANI